MNKYVLLVGAMKNFGDFLIVDRAKKLLRAHKPGVEFLELPRWEPINSHLEEVNTAKAIILCGGPAYQPKLYPKIYPLVEDLDSLNVPIIPFGLGWYEFPGDDISWKNFLFTDSSLKLLRKIHSNCAFSSCRDYLTKELLVRNGFKNVLMTGDPAWYDLEFMGKEFVPLQEIKRIGFSLPQRYLYHNQSVMAAEILKKLFPRAKLVCSFHRGISADQYTTIKEARRLQRLKETLESICDEVVDLSYDLARGGNVYRKCDLHVGYRLHAHILFLSQRKPSFLLEEDGRGRGFSEAIGLRGIPAYVRRPLSNFLDKRQFPRKMRGAFRRLNWIAAPRRTAAEELQNFIKEELDSDFIRFRGLSQIFDGYYQIMKQFLQSLP